jgi:sporulation protein YlmC with PRC-barrel domain
MRRIHVGFDLLDRQVLDRDGELVGKVDDVELSAAEGGPPTVVALLLGPQALGHRMGGWLGRVIEASARRLQGEPHPEPLRIAYERVASVDNAVRLRLRRAELREPALETWLRAHVIDRIPGAGNARQ